MICPGCGEEGQMLYAVTDSFTMIDRPERYKKECLVKTLDGYELWIHGPVVAVWQPGHYVKVG